MWHLMLEYMTISWFAWDVLSGELYILKVLSCRWGSTKAVVQGAAAEAPAGAGAGAGAEVRKGLEGAVTFWCWFVVHCHAF
jgi:hypothetical protein